MSEFVDELELQRQLLILQMKPEIMLILRIFEKIDHFLPLVLLTVRTVYFEVAM